MAGQTTAEPVAAVVPMAKVPPTERNSVKWQPTFTPPKYFFKKASLKERSKVGVTSNRPAFGVELPRDGLDLPLEGVGLVAGAGRPRQERGEEERQPGGARGGGGAHCGYTYSKEVGKKKLTPTLATKTVWMVAGTETMGWSG